MRRKVDDGFPGVRYNIHDEGLTDKDSVSTVETVQDVEPILEANKAAQSMGDGWTPSRDMRRVASIPLVIWEQWILETNGRLHNGMTKRERKRFVERKLKDPEYAFLRTADNTHRYRSQVIKPNGN